MFLAPFMILYPISYVPYNFFHTFVVVFSIKPSASFIYKIKSEHSLTKLNITDSLVERLNTPNLNSTKSEKC